MRFQTLFSLLLVWLLSGQGGFGQVYEKVYSFSAAGRVEGAFPRAKLLLASDGNFYGTTSHGGTHGYGTVFKMTPAGVRTTLVDFTYNASCNKGSRPYGALVEGSDGCFYGTTADGGLSAGKPCSSGDWVGYGTVFKVTPAGELTTLVQFTGNGTVNRGSSPVGGLVLGSDGNFYGTTYDGGAYGSEGTWYRGGYGTVFRMTPAGELTTLVDFTGNGATNKGQNPGARLVQGRDGNLYGITSRNGSYGRGAIFRMTPAGELTTLVEFGSGSSVIGENPYAALLEGSDGNFYGTTYSGDSIFRMTPSGDLTTLVQLRNCNGGTQPVAELVEGSDGNFYGTTLWGGETGYGSLFGTVFRMTPSGTLTTLVKFTGEGSVNRGQCPEGGLVQGPDGNFYGVTGNEYFYMTYPPEYAENGPGSGTIFKMTPSGLLTTLVEFNAGRSTDRASDPEAGLVEGIDGNFYGTTTGGGLNGYGTVFRMTPGGALTTLVHFTGDDGSYPITEMVRGSTGDFFGATSSSGPNGSGTLFKMTPSVGLTTLLGTGASRLWKGSDGNFYGTTPGGGQFGLGTVFRMTPAGEVTMLVEFTGNGTENKGFQPFAGLVEGSDGNFYGTTTGGGANGVGTVFKMTPAGVLTTLVEFTGNGPQNKGSQPFGALVQRRDGYFYGTTQGGERTGLAQFSRWHPVAS